MTVCGKYSWRWWKGWRIRKNDKHEILEIEHEVNKAAEKVYSTSQRLNSAKKRREKQLAALPSLNQDEKNVDFDAIIPQAVAGAYLAEPKRKRPCLHSDQPPSMEMGESTTLMPSRK